MRFCPFCGGTRVISSLTHRK
ncbi:DUF2752 domain-containing protein [Brenneria goodwinii]|nr:DUF2752 domain-containing protein [Brenneria goodwinii]MCG8160760.1 DUF2752 domain-containing protein [Brenneria goodwinii]MCG8165910.1 DUF2752 domain-containing protein [Brenneria goodwinii]MCG8170398.1 DUF2752 domain-containing protein [Brenneria goodwinii]MCG8175266.1 DUF2752 domain-containing protein [Brenneria goodwinii]